MASLFNIFALLLALPLQMLSFVQTLAHIDEHLPIVAVEAEVHEHSEDAAARTHDHLAGEHHHGDGGPIHSHTKELCGVFCQIVLSPLLSSVHQIIPASSEAFAIYPTRHLISRIAANSLFRPPIV